MRGFPFTQTPDSSDWDGETLFYRTLSPRGKLTLGFKKGKEKSAGGTFVCKRVHWCVNVVGTKEPFSCIVSVVNLMAVGRVTAGKVSVSPGTTLRPFLVGKL
jgi:hypothetical protein